MNATVTSLPLGDPTSFQIFGQIRGEPLGRTAAAIQRRFPHRQSPAGTRRRCGG